VEISNGNDESGEATSVSAANILRGSEEKGLGSSIALHKRSTRSISTTK
jgi:hypothetical protein